MPEDLNLRFSHIRATIERSAKTLVESEREIQRASERVRELQELEVAICFTPRPGVARGVQERPVRVQ